MRLDKWISNAGVGSRKEVKQLLKDRHVHVNGQIEKSASFQVDPDKDVVELKGRPVYYQEFVYYMLNKPPGVITATEDSKHETVLNLMDEKDRMKGLYPVGRLDKDTEGLLLLTNDGPLGHRLLSPKHHVDKTYEAIINGPITTSIFEAFDNGIKLVGDGVTLPAKLKVLREGKEPKVEIVITEGKFHQIKRMFHAVEREVLFLKRTKMGPLSLDPLLQIGHYRPLTEEEQEEILK